MVTLSEQLSGINFFDGIIQIKDKIIDGINSLIRGFSNENPVAVVLLFSILIGIGIKRWKKLEWIEGIIMMILIFGFFRFMNIGG